MIEHFGHPELIAAGVPLGHASHILNDMGEMVRDGTRFEAGRAELEVPHATVSIGSVHSVHVSSGVVDMWSAQYEARRDRPELEIVQVLIEPSRHQPKLDRPHANLYLDRHPRRGRPR